MKTLTNYINEKYLIDINTKREIDPNDKKEYTKILNTIGSWLLEKDTFRHYGKNNRFEFLRYINNNLLELIDYYQGTFEKFMKELDMNNTELSYFIEKYNDELIDAVSDFYQEFHNRIPY